MKIRASIAYQGWQRSWIFTAEMHFSGILSGLETSYLMTTALIILLAVLLDSRFGSRRLIARAVAQVLEANDQVTARQ